MTSLVPTEPTVSLNDGGDLMRFDQIDPASRRQRLRPGRRPCPWRARPRLSPRVEAMEGRMLLSSIRGDFNGDSYSDLAVGVPEETLDPGEYDGELVIRGTGSVHIIPGSRDGLQAFPVGKFWHQATPGIFDDPE